MKAKPKFTGIWYGVMCVKDQPVEVPAHLEERVAMRPDLFVKPGRKRKVKDDQDES